MDALLSDFRHAVRGLFLDPSYALTAVVSLALAIGVNVAVFGVTNAVLLRPLPVASGDRLVRVAWRAGERTEGLFSLPELRNLAGSGTLEAVAGHQANLVVVSAEGGEPLQVMGELVTTSYFGTLGLAPALGALPGDEGPGERAVVLGHGLWTSRFGADPGVVGRTVSVNSVPLLVAGVAPRGFRGVIGGLDVSLWIPLSLRDEVWRDESGALEDRESRSLMAFGRLRRGVGPEAAAAGLQATLDAWPTSDGGADSRTHRRVVVARARGVHPFLAERVGGFVLLLSAVVGLVLVAAAANVANLQLARAWSRRREMAVRRSVGGSTGRIVRKLLTESLVLALAGGLGGVVVGASIAAALPRLLPPVGIPVALDLSMDARVLAFSLALSGAVALLAGLAPAAFAARESLAGPLREEGSTGTGRMGWPRRAFVASQVAVATVLLTATGLMIRSLHVARGLDPGFEVGGGWVLQAEAGLLGDDDRARRFWEELTARARDVPGVRHAALALLVPMGDRGDRMAIAHEGWEGDPERPPLRPYNLVGPGYFETLGIDLVAGRGFTALDDAGAPAVAIVSEAAARSFWPGESGLGRTLVVRGRDGVERTVQVVGVAGDVSFASPGAAPGPLVYLPLAQSFRPDLYLHVRASDPAALAQVGRVARGLEPELPFRLRTLAETSSFVLVPVRILRWVLGGAGLSALALAVAGLFGTVSYVVARRVKEIGIRMALGATPARTAAAVAGESLVLAGAGALLGLPLALALGGVLRSFLYGVSPADPLALVSVLLLLVGLAGLAAWWPARRAARVDPCVALREG